MKTDAYIKDIVVAAIRRKSTNMDAWVGTRLWDEGHSDIKTKLTLSCRFEHDELPILYSHVDHKNWTLVTSRGIWCAADNRNGFVAASDFTLTKDWAPNFKGRGRQAIDRMLLGSRSGETYYCPYHTGAQSMGTLYAVLTLFRISKRR